MVWWEALLVVVNARVHSFFIGSPLFCSWGNVDVLPTARHGVGRGGYRCGAKVSATFCDRQLSTRKNGTHEEIGSDYSGSMLR